MPKNKTVTKKTQVKMIKKEPTKAPKDLKKEVKIVKKDLEKTSKISKEEPKKEISTKTTVVSPIAEQPAVLLTKEGLKKIQDELDYLQTTKREEIAKKLQNAISYGDLSENAEYDEAKNEQAFVVMRIAELQQILEKAQIISAAHAHANVVELGSTVHLNNITFKRDEKYTIVASTEADPLKGMISNESPVGKVLLSVPAGEKVKANTPRGVIEYKILKI